MSANKLTTTTWRGCKRLFTLSRVSRIETSTIILMLLSPTIFSQVFGVKGTISISTSPVKNACITFIDQGDTSKQFRSYTDSSGHFQMSVNTKVPPSSSPLPQNIELQQNYPNPFSTTTTIPYQLNKQSEVSLKIYDILGREVRTLSIGSEMIGPHELLWDGRNSVGQKIAVGVYFCELRSKNETHVRKMIFSGGNAAVSIPGLTGFSRNPNTVQGEVVERSTGRTYMVQIANTNGTRPKVFATQFPNIIIQQDTTLNFDVQSQIMAFSLCYQRPDSITYHGTNQYLAWSIHLNNIMGTGPKTIINWPRNSEGAQWSPNGNYIAFTREDTLGYVQMYLYDTANDSLITNPIHSDTTSTGFLGWTPDGKVIYGRSNYYVAGVTQCIMNVDGSNNRILKYDPIYFYPDSYNFLTDSITSSKGPSVYHSDIDGAYLEFIEDLGKFVSTKNGGVSICDYNPNANDLLLLFDDPSTTLPNTIAKYNVTVRRLDTIAVSDSGWKCYRPRYSHDFSKIAVAEMNAADVVSYTNRISILDLASESKTTVVEFPDTDATGRTQLLDYNPFAFSVDDKYLAYSKNVYKPGYWVSWISYLYVVQLETAQSTYIDRGIDPLWNPSKSH